MSLDQTTAFRLSLQQRRLWLLQKDGSVFSSQLALKIHCKLEPELLKQALAAIVRRHQSLRTVFRHVPGLKMPCQVIIEKPNFLLQELDWGGLDDAVQQERLRDLACAELQHPFNWSEGPLISCVLVQLTPHQSLVLITIASLCADSNTLTSLARHLGQFFSNRSLEVSSSEQEVEYTQFSEWNHELLEDEDAAAGKAYWNRQKFGDLVTGTLPLERKMQQPKNFHPEAVPVQLPREVLELVTTADSEISNFLFACWQVLIWRLTSQSDVLIGRIHGGRDYEELKPVFGLFAKVLPEMAHLHHNLRFSKLLESGKRVWEEAEEWQAYFSWEPSAPETDFSPFLFEEEKWFPGINGRETRLKTLWQESEIDRYKLKLKVVNADECRTTLHFDPALFDPDVIERFARYFSTLAMYAARDSECKLGQLPILNGRDLEEVLTRFNPVQKNSSFPETILSVLEQVVARTPQKAALIGSGRQVTFAELDHRTNQLARYLQQQGIQPEMPVAIAMERGPEMIVGLIAILKAGGAYVPLDPTYPRERITLVLEDTRTPLVLTQKHVAALLPEHPAQTVLIDADWEKISQLSDASLPVAVLSDNLAYVIYTSGSTGTPKGVLISHRNLAYSTFQRNAYYSDVTGFLLLSSFSFDSSVAGIFGTLCAGATLYVPEESVQMDINRIAQIVDEAKISHLLCLPSLYTLLLKQADAGKIASLKAVIVAGEACDRDLAGLHFRVLPDAQLHNEYGPTEATVWSTVHRIRREDSDSSVPIGRPVPNTCVYLLDSNLSPLALGLPGEIYIGGPGLSRGYLRQPGITAERFIPDPHSDTPGARLYKTGDIGTYRNNGDIEFGGRLDNQIKLRGYRIELDEVEHALRQHPAIHDVLVTMQEEESDEKRLVAYIVGQPSNAAEAPPMAASDQTGADQEGALNSISLRGFLRKRMPEYMIPSAFEFLDQFPLLPNGKINRKQLPKPGSNGARDAKSFAPPTSALELQIASLWGEMLKVSRVGIDDNFFDLGGHSFLAIKMHYQLCQDLKLDVPLLKLFEHPTVRKLAQFLEQEQKPSPDAFRPNQVDNWAAHRRAALQQQRELIQKTS